MASKEIESLYDEWGKGTVMQAFALQQHIVNEGLDGIYFMHDEGTGRSGESRAKRVKHGTTKSTIIGEMDSSY